MCLLALAVAVKPLADIVANYACCDRHKKADQDFQHLHPPLLPEWRRAAPQLYHNPPKSASGSFCGKHFRCPLDFAQNHWHTLGYRGSVATHFCGDFDLWYLLNEVIWLQSAYHQRLDWPRRLPVPNRNAAACPVHQEVLPVRSSAIALPGEFLPTSPQPSSP